MKKFDTKNYVLFNAIITNIVGEFLYRRTKIKIDDRNRNSWDDKFYKYNIYLYLKSEKKTLLNPNLNFFFH